MRNVQHEQNGTVPLTGTVVAIRSYDDEQGGMLCAALSALSRFAYERGIHEFYIRLSTDKGVIKRILEQQGLVESFVSEDPEYIALITSNRDEKTVKLSLHRKSETQKPDQKKQLISTITSFVDKHFQDSSMSLVSIADRFGITPQYLSFLFKKNQMVNLHDYISLLRINKARQLLADCGDSIAAIANQVGYTNVVSFGRVFKKVAEMTPTEYRRSMRQIEAEITKA